VGRLNPRQHNRHNKLRLLSPLTPHQTRIFQLDTKITNRRRTSRCINQLRRAYGMLSPSSTRARAFACRVRLHQCRLPECSKLSVDDGRLSPLLSGCNSVHPFATIPLHSHYFSSWQAPDPRHRCSISTGNSGICIYHLNRYFVQTYRLTSTYSLS